MDVDPNRGAASIRPLRPIAPAPLPPNAHMYTVPMHAQSAPLVYPSPSPSARPPYPSPPPTLNYHSPHLHHPPPPAFQSPQIKLASSTPDLRFSGPPSSLPDSNGIRDKSRDDTTLSVIQDRKDNRGSLAPLLGSRGRHGPRVSGLGRGLAEMADLKESLDGVATFTAAERERERWAREEAWVGILALLAAKRVATFGCWKKWVGRIEAKESESEAIANGEEEEEEGRRANGFGCCCSFGESGCSEIWGLGSIFGEEDKLINVKLRRIRWRSWRLRYE